MSHPRSVIHLPLDEVSLPASRLRQITQEELDHISPLHRILAEVLIRRGDIELVKE